MKKSYIELLPALFDIFSTNYGTGDKNEKFFGSIRNKFLVAPIKTVPNGGGKYKIGALCLHLEEYTSTLLICSAVPVDGKPIENIVTAISIGRPPGSKKPYLINFSRTQKIEHPEDAHVQKLLDIRGEIVAQIQQLRKSDKYEMAKEFAMSEKPYTNV